MHNISDKDSFSYYYHSHLENTIPFSSALILCSSHGNFFMREIAKQLEFEIKRFIPKTCLSDETFSIDSAKHFDFLLIVAPHEFFELGKVQEWQNIFQHHPMVILYNTEQKQTNWFELSKKYFDAAKAILDIDYDTANYCRVLGYPSYFLPPAQSDYFQSIAHQPFSSTLTQYLPKNLTASPSHLKNRYFDILFVGTMTPKRNKFFSNNSSLFASYNCFIYIPELNTPLKTESPIALTFSQFINLSRHSKIVLNIHRDEAPYFEWQRIVNLGIMQNTPVISDNCSENPIIRKNIDYKEAELAALPDLITYQLNRIDQAESEIYQANTHLNQFTTYKMLTQFLHGIL